MMIVKLCEKSYNCKVLLLKYFGSRIYLGDNQIVIKICPENSRSLEEFQQEVKIHTDCQNHPNICKLYDSGIWENENREKFYIFVMEWGNLGDLRDYRASKMSDDSIHDGDEIQNLIRQMTESIAHVHKMGYYHNDVKPENFIIVQKDNESPQVRLIDFECASKNNQPVVVSEIMTFCMRPPEAIISIIKKQRSAILPKADIYSLGITIIYFVLHINVFSQSIRNLINQLMERLNLFEPYKFPEYQGIVLNGKKKNSPLTADILANLDKDLVSLLRNMMENDVEKRFNIDDVMKHKYFEKVS